MSDDKKAEVVLALWQAAWLRIQDRRRTEWKLAFSMWGGIAAFGGVALKSDFNYLKLARVSAFSGYMIVLLGLVSTVLLQVYCLQKIRQRHALDRAIAAHLSLVLGYLLSIHPTGEGNERQLEEVSKEQARSLDWSHRVQLANDDHSQFRRSRCSTRAAAVAAPCDEGMAVGFITGRFEPSRTVPAARLDAEAVTARRWSGGRAAYVIY